jgi:adenylate cyclase
MRLGSSALNGDRFSQVKRGAQFVVLLAVFILLTLPVFIGGTRDGLSTIREEANAPPDFATGVPIKLTGSWHFQVIAPEPQRTGMLAVPGPWQGAKLANGEPAPTMARVRYSLVLHRVPAGDYRLYLEPVFGASQVAINGSVRSERGTIGDDARTSRYAVLAHDVAFSSAGGDLAIAIDVSTFRDVGTGLRQAPVLGGAVPMQRLVVREWAKLLLIGSTFLMIGLFALIVYANRPADRSALLLGLGSFAIMGALLASGFENVVLFLAPRLLQGAYDFLLLASTDLGTVLWVAYAREVFPGADRSRGGRAILVGLTAFAFFQLAVLLIGGEVRASQVSHAFPYAFGLAASYIFFVSWRAFRQAREGSALFMLGQVAVVVALSVQILANFRDSPIGALSNFDFATYGILIFAFLHLLVLARRWSASINAAETLTEDLGRLLEVNTAVASEGHLETLLERIVGVTSRIVDAERSTLFLHDSAKDELWSLVAEGMGLREIRLPASSGIAGHVFVTGDTLRIDRPYDDPRFNAEVDAETGFATHNIMAAPLVARDGRRLGVLQVLNSRHGAGFTAADAKRLSAFAAQAAIAIDNANLFTAVVEARNRNESILASMSSGVVTLQDDGRTARFNAAARTILGLEDVPEGPDSGAAVAFAADNPDLRAQVAAVSASGQPRSLLDHEIVTPGKARISANVSLVPLREGERVSGVLMMIDDITSGKRLEGAMRRFMTQDVLDQVLAHEGDMLFGVGCRASVLFADIRGFTTMSEKLSAREVVDMLNEIFTDLFDAVADHDGVLDKYIGDAVMAVFGAPLSRGDDATNAVRAALRMLDMVAAINVRRTARNEPPVRLGIGIATGEIVAGTIGSPKRMDYTVIGDSVNLAARLQDLTKTYGEDLIVDQATATAVETTVALRQIDMVAVRGRARQETIFGLSQERVVADIAV